jgi:hypothetical protein
MTVVESIRAFQPPHGEFDSVVGEFAPALDLAHVAGRRIAIEKRPRAGRAASRGRVKVSRTNPSSGLRRSDILSARSRGRFGIVVNSEQLTTELI